jgi:hypothetical protein
MMVSIESIDFDRDGLDSIYLFIQSGMHGR